MADETPDRVAATLAGIRKRADWTSNRYAEVTTVRDSAEDVPRLLAAVEAALKLADKACELEVRGVRLDWWDLSPSRLRAAITAALTGEEAGDGE